MPVGGQQVFASDVTMPPPVQAGDGIDQAPTATASPGSPVIGVVFTAPPSGRVRLYVFAALRLTATPAGAIICGAYVRAGAVINAGAMVFDGVATEPGCRGFLSGYLGYVTTSASAMVEGLTPGASYNATLQHLVQSSATGTVMSRQIGVDPLP